MQTIKIVRVKISDIKTTYFQPENSKAFVNALCIMAKMLLPFEKVVVHKETMELIANGHYLQAAQMDGQEYLEVAMADFPVSYLLNAVATHWSPPKTMVKLYPLIQPFMSYYDIKNNGDGVVFRKDLGDDLSLRELVATILGTNRTYLDWIEAIGDYKPELLEWIDKGDVTLKEAFSIVPKPKTGKGNKTGKPNDKGENGDNQFSNNYIKPIGDLDQLTTDELDEITQALPPKIVNDLDSLLCSGFISISKAFTYNHIFQGFFITFESEGKSVITNIVYTDSLKSVLLQAA